MEEKLNNGYYDDDWIVNEDDSAEESLDESDESYEDEDFFKVPKVPSKRKIKREPKITDSR